METTPDERFEPVDDTYGPDIFADGIAGLLLHNGNLRISLEYLRATHVDPAAKVNRVVIGAS